MILQSNKKNEALFLAKEPKEQVGKHCTYKIKCICCFRVQEVVLMREPCVSVPALLKSPPRDTSLSATHNIHSAVYTDTNLDL